MNNDIATMRAAIAGITQLITQRGLQVTQQGIDAYVRKDPKTHQPVLVNIPYLPDSASPALVMAIQGFIDHECGHVLETDYSVWAEVERWAGENARKGIPNTFAMWNITEDTFIERKMCERFKGTAYNLERMQEFFLAELTAPTLAKAVAAGDHARAFNVLLVPMARAWSGQDVFVRFMADKWHLVADEVRKIGPLKDRFPLLAHSRDAFDLAKGLVTALYVAPPPKVAKPAPAPKPAEKKTPEPKAKDEPKEETPPEDKSKQKLRPEPKEEDEAPPAANANEPEESEDDAPEAEADDGDDADDEAGAGGEDSADEGDGDGDDDEGEGAGGGEAGDDGSAGADDAEDPAGFDKNGTRDPLKRAHRKILAARYDRKMTFEEIAQAARLPVEKIISLHDAALTVIEANKRAA